MLRCEMMMYLFALIRDAALLAHALAFHLLRSTRAASRRPGRHFRGWWGNVYHDQPPTKWTTRTSRPRRPAAAVGIVLWAAAPSFLQQSALIIIDRDPAGRRVDVF